MKTNIAMLVVAAFAGCFITINPAFSQTWLPTSSPSNTWPTIASSPDGSKLFAGDFFHWIYGISTNSGATWITYTQPQSGSTYYSWSYVASSADATKLARTIGNVIWVSTNSGPTWLSNNVPGVDFFASMAFSADGNKLVAVVGFNNTPGPIFTSTDSGFTLTPTTAPINNWMSVASSADGTKLVAAGMNPGYQGGFIYTSMDAGLTWTLTSAPTNNTWGTVASSADGSKLVAASWTTLIANHNHGCVYTSTNSGLIWISNNVPDAQWQSVASSADGTKLVAVSVVPEGWVYTSINSGATWISNNVPNETWVQVASSADGEELALVSAGPNPDPIYMSRITSSPRLNLAPTNNNLTLSWIVPSTNLVVQQSSDLGSWMDVTNTPELNLANLRNEVILPPAGSSGFYRLKTP